MGFDVLKGFRVVEIETTVHLDAGEWMLGRIQ